jgi:hypothetical protein
LITMKSQNSNKNLEKYLPIDKDAKIPMSNIAM